MNKIKALLIVIIAISFVLSSESSVWANACNICGKKIYIGDRCVECAFNQFVNKLEHPCKNCGKKIFFGSICKDCKKKAEGSRKNEVGVPIKNFQNEDAINEGNKASTAEKKQSSIGGIWNRITSFTNNAYRTVFGTNKHD